jgi:hypothetical protein
MTQYFAQDISVVPAGHVPFISTPKKTTANIHESVETVRVLQPL